MSLIKDENDQRLLAYRRQLIGWMKSLPWWRRLLNKFE